MTSYLITLGDHISEEYICWLLERSDLKFFLGTFQEKFRESIDFGSCPACSSTAFDQNSVW
jgi:hypothetical protein